MKTQLKRLIPYSAENTQNLVEDIVNISSKMKENKAIAKTLQESTDIFAIF